MHGRPIPIIPHTGTTTPKTWRGMWQGIIRASSPLIAIYAIPVDIPRQMEHQRSHLPILLPREPPTRDDQILTYPLWKRKQDSRWSLRRREPGSVVKYLSCARRQDKRRKRQSRISTREAPWRGRLAIPNKRLRRCITTASLEGTRIQIERRRNAMITRRIASQRTVTSRLVLDSNHAQSPLLQAGECPRSSRKPMCLLSPINRRHKLPGEGWKPRLLVAASLTLLRSPLISISVKGLLARSGQIIMRLPSQPSPQHQ